MSYCFHPHCQKPQNPTDSKFCQSCGSKLLLKERYRAVKLIGQGGFGRTFLGVDEDKPSKPRCAIKQFFPQAQGTDNAQKAAELFEQEAVRLDELGKHPQIPELLAHFSQDNRQYLVQEFIDGQNLAAILQAEGAFSESQIRSLLNSVLPVFEFIHDRQVIHRDIKPENILLRPDGQLVLVDFGAAKFATETALLKTGTTIGTPEYIAPEQTRGKAVFASDLYSLGVTCLYLLTQISPFELFDIGEDTWGWRQYLVNNSVSDELGIVLDKLIENGINKRYRSAADVIQDLNLLSRSKNIPIVTQTNSFTALEIENELTALKTQLEVGKQPINPIEEELTAMKAQLIISSSTKAELTTTTPQLLPNWQCVHTLNFHSERVNSVAISPDGKTLVSGSDDTTIILWDLNTGKYLKSFSVLGSVWCVAISPNGQTITSGDLDKTIMLRNFHTGVVYRTLFSRFSSLTSHSGYVYSVAFSPDGTVLASGSADRTIRLWEFKTGELLTTLKVNDTVWCVAISPDGQTLVSGNADNSIKIWKLNNINLCRTLTGHLEAVNAVAISPDSQIIASGSEDNTIKIWHLKTGKLIRTLEGHSDSVLSVAISPDGQTLASGSKDNTIKIWHFKDGKLCYNLSEHFKAVKSLVFSPDGETLVSGSWDKTIKIWRDSAKAQQRT